MARSIDVPLTLENGVWNGWRLDGSRTLKAYQRQTGRLPEDEDFGTP
jgi:hypothetical protein